MGEIRCLNAAGINQFEKFVRALGRGESAAFPGELLEGSGFGRVVLTTDESVSNLISLETKFSIGRDIEELRKKSAGRLPVDDAGLWCWLAARFIQDVCEKDAAGKFIPGPVYKWILDADWQRFYRHIFAGPWRIFSLHSQYPELVEPLLHSSPTANTELYEQIASSQEVVQSAGVLEGVRALYWESTTLTLKKGHAGKGGGSVRRFATFLNQIALTWDLNGISGSELLNLLPAEFDRWR